MKVAIISRNDEYSNEIEATLVTLLKKGRT